MSERRTEFPNHDTYITALIKAGYFDKFSRPVTSSQAEKIKSKHVLEKMPDFTYKTSFVIGRFQPVHRGHLYLIQQALAVAENVVIGIGIATKRDRNNPFSAEQREEMLQRALEKEGIHERVRLVRINDYEDDDLWLREALRKVKAPIDVVVGNNTWVNGIFEKAGYKTVEIPLLERDRLSGTQIREVYLYPSGILSQ